MNKEELNSFINSLYQKQKKKEQESETDKKS